MTTENFLCEFTKTLLKYYLLEPTQEHFSEIMLKFSEDFVLIGTGKEEYFTCLEEAISNIIQLRSATELISFEVINEWEKCIKIAENAYLVYGVIRVCENEIDGMEALIDMDTRFSVIYRLEDEEWKIVHVHQSIPSLEQLSGEYYPRTLKEKAKAAIIKAELYQEKSEMDLMTGIYNNESFKVHVKQKLTQCNNGIFYLFDLDYFKLINDTYGHMIGDEILKLFSKLLKKFFTNASIGRMGGDEFFVFQWQLEDKQQIDQKIELLQSEFQEASKELLKQQVAEFTVGMAYVTQLNESFEELFSIADKELYHKKNNRVPVDRVNIR